MRWLVFLLAGACACAAAHQNSDEHPFQMPGTPAKVVPAPTPWLTGEQLLLQLDPPANAPGRQSMIDGATGYLKGNFDATESGLWCYTDGKRRPTPKQTPDAMRASVIAHLRTQSHRALQGKAAVLVVQMWQDKWPCSPDGCCP